MLSLGRFGEHSARGDLGNTYPREILGNARPREILGNARPGEIQGNARPGEILGAFKQPNGAHSTAPQMPALGVSVYYNSQQMQY